MELLIPTGSAEGTGDRAAGSSLLAEIVQGAPVPLWVIGPTGTVVIANRAAVSFLGYRTDQDVVGGPSHDLLHRHRLDGSDYPAEDCPIVCSTGSGVPRASGSSPARATPAGCNGRRTLSTLRARPS
ncbi:PAS domain-containing protein [Vibrio cholerae]|nr:PAS domain-containing protein [Vibrio cholerae]